MKRTACSSPRSTPRATTKTVRPMNRVWHRPTATQLPMNPLNWAPTWLEVAPAKVPSTLLAMYASVQPAMTL